MELVFYFSVVRQRGRAEQHTFHFCRCFFSKQVKKKLDLKNVNKHFFRGGLCVSNHVTKKTSLYSEGEVYKKVFYFLMAFGIYQYSHLPDFGLLLEKHKADI